MELISQCFVERNTALTKSLLSNGFSAEQVVLFLPEAASAIYQATQQTSVFQTIACLMPGASCQQPGIIDVDTIAKKSVMDSVKVKAGLHAIAPVLLQAVAQFSSHQAQSPVRRDISVVF